ncbi:MAG: ARMT1-like domain-containing protein [Thermodesulfobacteriota bacterium]|nr:ARMT1-like domain-containing protein [Thermodesulfobacteriota bacterium]
MKPDVDCAACILKWVYQRARVLSDEEERFYLIKEILGVLSSEFCAESNMGLICNKATESISEFIMASAEYYEEFKIKSNKHVGGLLPAARDYIQRGKTPDKRFERACCLASVANVAPIGAPSDAYSFAEVENIMMGRGPMPVVIGDVYKAAKGAANVLYIVDNAGEIGFDFLVIESLKEMGLKVTLIVKEESYFEDATIKDASFFALDELADKILIVKGVFVPGESIPTIHDAFKQSDLVIAKGTGNYEALADELVDKAAIFMLKVKCGPVAKNIGVEIGNFVVKLVK